MYMDGVMKEVKMGMGRMKLKFSEEERGWKFPTLLHVDDLTLPNELEEEK